MNTSVLVRRSLAYYWRTNLAVVAGVATAVAVLSGALLVGDSVRGSLRGLVEQRLGRTSFAVVSSGFFREALAGDVANQNAFPQRFAGITPLIVLPGVVTEQEHGRRAGRVHVYGVDDRFWQFHGLSAMPGVGERDAVVNAALAAEIGVETGQAILVRVQRPSDIPLESLQGNRDDLGRTLRLTVRGVVSSSSLGEFSLDPQQGAVLAVFVALSRLQQELEIPGRANTLLVSAKDTGTAATDLEPIVRGAARLEDVGLKVRTTEVGSAVIVESDAGLLDTTEAAAIQQALTAAGMPTRAVFTYLANAMRHGNREIPYSLVSAIGVSATAPTATTPTASAGPSIVLNTWAARELLAAPGDTVVMDYFLWEDRGRLVTESSEFRVASVVPVETGDRDLAPNYPGISDSASLSAWDPPFPVDLRKIRPADEDYWERYRTTPKAFVALDVGQRLWTSRYGAVTSIRVAADRLALDVVRGQVEERVRSAIDPLTTGLAVRNVRADGVASSRGATDFGEYFVYFSFFIVVSALLLAALFFKLGIEHRAREVGLLRAVGLGPAAVRRLFLVEGVLLAAIGSAIGMLGAVGYAALLMAGLRTWWVDAVGTTALTLHVTGQSLVAGAFGGVTVATLCIWWTLGSLSAVSERSLLAGQSAGSLAPSGSPGPSDVEGSRRSTAPSATSGSDRTRRLPKPSRGVVAGALTSIAAVLMAAGANGSIDPAGAFFGAGSALLVASLCVFSIVLRRRPQHAVGGRGWWAVSRLGMRSATYRPGRSVLSMAVMASATFILIAVGAFRRDGTTAADDPHSGTGGYALIVESLLPVVQDPNTPEGRDALNLLDLDSSVRIEPFRLRPGDDVSCLNLYDPRNPRVIAPRPSFIAAGRFAFQDALTVDAADAANPWRLLDRPLPNDAVPVIADANSLTYVLQRRLGEDLVISSRGRPVTLRIVASLRDSIFQGELLMSDANFLRLFPEQEGFQFLLVDSDAGARDRTRATIEAALSDLGADATGTGERLAAFHRVENTYLSTFQTLGGLGLLVGTVGMATVLLRNVLERRRELALLGAVGFERRHFVLMAVAENTVLVTSGLAAGALSAALAVAPAISERGGGVPLASGALLLVFGVFLVALMSSMAAVAGATRRPLLESLRSE